MRNTRRKFPFTGIFQAVPASVDSGEGESDPIGDALRADLMAYWTFDEAAGNTRLDSTVSNADLLETADATPPPNAPIGSIAGKVGNAVKIFDNTVSQDMLANSGQNIPIPNFMTAFGWFKISALNGDGQVHSGIGLVTGAFNNITTPFIVRRGDGTMYVTAGQYVIDPGLADVVADTWYFCLTEYDFILDTATISINNGSAVSLLIVIDLPFIKTQSPFEILYCGFANYVDNADWIALDEWGFADRQLTSDEKAYLYNSGNGRTLYP